MNSETQQEPYLKYRISNSSRIEAFVDAMSNVKECEYEADDNFFYVTFEEPSKIARKLFDIVFGWRVTKVWINGKEVEEQL